MSWLFSRALVEAYSEGCCSDGEQSALLSLMLTQQPFLRKDKMMEFSDLSQYGATSQLLTESRGEGLLMSFLAAFPARTSAQQGKGPELRVIDQGSGWKWRESSVKYDPNMRLWKTRQCSLLEDSEWFLETWPRWGLMHDGECWELPMSERPTFVKGSGLLPTPTANSYGSCQGGSGGREGQPNRPSLQSMANRGIWPTPHGFIKDGKSNGPSGNELGRAVNLATFPTPRAKSKSGGGIGLDGGTGSREKIIATLGEKACKELTGGSLNPTWVEWLMGWPPEWTDLQPWEMDKCHSVQQQRGVS